MKQSDAFRTNSSGYSDPTAYNAVKKIENDDARVSKLITILKYICDISGFEIQGHIVLKDKASGRVWH